MERTEVSPHDEINFRTAKKVPAENPLRILATVRLK